MQTVPWPCVFTGFNFNSSVIIGTPDTVCCIESVEKDQIVAGSSACTLEHVEDLSSETIAAGNFCFASGEMADASPDYPCGPNERDTCDDEPRSDIKAMSFSERDLSSDTGKDKSPESMNSGNADDDHTKIFKFDPTDSQDEQLAADLVAATRALKHDRHLLLPKVYGPGGSVLPTGIGTDANCNNETGVEKTNVLSAINVAKLQESSYNCSAEQELSTSLRAWLNNSARVIDKIEILHIFKQIAEFVELAHSQGVILRNVRPSSFLLSSMSRISIIESASDPNTSSSSSAESTGRGAASNLRDLFASDKVTQVMKNSASTAPMGSEMHKESGPPVPMDRRRGSTNLENKSGDNTRQLKIETGKEKNVADDDEGGRSYTSSSSDHADNLNDEKFPLKEILSMEMMWYRSPEELSGGTADFPSDMYSLGVLLVELFYKSGSQGEWSRAMSDLRHRLLAPSFLLEFPKEAAFCLLLLHPNPNCRPKAREILHADIFSEIEDKLAEREATMYLEENLSEAETTLDFLLQMQRRKHVVSQKLAHELRLLDEDIGEVKKWQALLTKSDWNEGFKSKSIRLLGSIESSDVIASGHSQDGLNGRRQELLVTKSAQLLKSFTELRESYLSRIKKEQHSGTGLTDEILKQSKLRNEHTEKMGIVRFLNTLSSSKAAEGSAGRLGCFFDDFCKFMKYSKFDVRATLQYGDILNTKNMVCSLNFDCDDEYFATAGVSRRIKIFDCKALLEEFNDVHYPVIEMNTRKKLSCVCWNNFHKNSLSSSDLEGVVQLWDVTTGQTIMELKEHSKCAWSVDFSHFDSSKLASGSDDCCVKVWSSNQGTSTGTIKTKANICSVQFSPYHSHILAFGSADSKVYFHDLRYSRIPICILTGHQKAVSFVRFAGPSSIVSASTDNTLKLWDLTKISTAARACGAGLASRVECMITYTGHTNLKNFVGLSVSEEGYIACGSETNEVFVYHKSLPVPMLSHKFKSADPISGQELEDLGDQFVSSVCWRNKSPVLVMANSVGNIQVLEMI